MRPREPHPAGGGGARDVGALGEGRHPAVRQAELAHRQLRRAGAAIKGCKSIQVSRKFTLIAPAASNLAFSGRAPEIQITDGATLSPHLPLCPSVSGSVPVSPSASLALCLSFRGVTGCLSHHPHRRRSRFDISHLDQPQPSRAGRLTDLHRAYESGAGLGGSGPQQVGAVATLPF